MVIVVGVFILLLIFKATHILLMSFIIIPFKAKKMLLRLSKGDYTGVYTIEQQDKDKEDARKLECFFDLEKACRARGFIFYELSKSYSRGRALKSSYPFNGDIFFLDYAEHCLKQMHSVRRKRK